MTPETPKEFEPDYNSIADCETSANHHIGWIKTELDSIRDQSHRLIGWRFLIIGLAFILGVIRWGPEPILKVSKLLMEITRDLNERFSQWVQAGKPRGGF